MSKLLLIPVLGFLIVSTVCLACPVDKRLKVRAIGRMAIGSLALESAVLIVQLVHLLQ